MSLSTKNINILRTIFFHSFTVFFSREILPVSDFRLVSAMSSRAGSKSGNCSYPSNIVLVLLGAVSSK